jgi:anti-sigma factor RsiW
VPPALRERVRRAVGIGASHAQPSWRALAASMALAAILSSGGTWYAFSPPAGDSLTEAVVASHLRALMAPQPTDISSSDQHTVKPWFAGRIPQAPRVVDLAREGFPLVGGRIDVVGRTAVPSLVYSRRQHLISLTAIPGSRAPAPPQTAQGFTLIGWVADGVSYWAVSDLNRGELETFARLFREAPL